MKKVLKWLLIVVVLFFVVYALYYYGLLDTRFWTYDKKVYTPLYNGTYVCGEDIEPGSYDVEIKGFSQDGGWIIIKDVLDPEKEEMIPIYMGDKGSHFSIEDGQVMTVMVNSGRDMRYKKAK